MWGHRLYQKLGRAPTGLCTRVAVPQVDGARACASGWSVASVQSSLVGWGCRLCPHHCTEGSLAGAPLPGPDHKAVVQQEGRAEGSAPLAWAVGSEAAQSPWLCGALASVHQLCWAAGMTLPGWIGGCSTPPGISSQASWRGEIGGCA